MCFICDASVFRLVDIIPSITSADLQGRIHLGYYPLSLAIEKSVFGSNPVASRCVILSQLMDLSEPIGKWRRSYTFTRLL